MEMSIISIHASYPHRICGYAFAVSIDSATAPTSFTTGNDMVEDCPKQSKLNLYCMNKCYLYCIVLCSNMGRWFGLLHMDIMAEEYNAPAQLILIM